MDMGARILVIEDDPGIRANILDLLEAEGYEAVGAADGSAGIEAALAAPPDLVLCDVTMPVLDGYAVLRALGASDATYASRFVFLSAKADRSDARRALSLGADDYVVKPFTRTQLLQTIRVRLARAKAPRVVEADGKLGGRYALGEPIGRGGLGVVYAAVDEATGAEVAVKLLPPNAVSDTAGFAKEQAALARLPEHPAIAPCLAHGITPGGQVWIAMRRLRGEPLGVRLAREPLTFGETALLAARVLDALKHAHGRGVVHRDIKPTNLFLEGGVESVALLDFGIAPMLAASQTVGMTGRVVGTALYMPPEAATGGPIGPRADLYALGCVLYECLAGRPPFEGDSLPAIVTQHLSADLIPVATLRPGTPPALAHTIESMLARSPDARPRDAAHAASLLRR
jgi:CheY-like chemotaxis protein